MSDLNKSVEGVIISLAERSSIGKPFNRIFIHDYATVLNIVNEENYFLVSDVIDKKCRKLVRQKFLKSFVKNGKRYYVISDDAYRNLRKQKKCKI